MSNYEKPVVMVNEELAEGVYAASGSACWEISAEIHDWTRNNDKVEVGLSGKHTNPGKHVANVCVNISFDQAITSASGSGWSYNISGNTVAVTCNKNTSNPTENLGGNIEVGCVDKAKLSITGVSWDCLGD